MNYAQDIGERVRKVAAEGLDIASKQEAGMSETPLSQLFTEFRSGKNSSPIEIALVGLDADSVPRVLGSLLGQDYPLCRVVVPDRLGYSEIHLQEHGFIFEADGQRREYEAPEALFRAIEAARASGSGQASWSDPVRLSIQAPVGRSGVVLLIPDSMESLATKPALLSVIAARANFLVIAGPGGHSLDADTKLTLNSLLEALSGVQCVVTDVGPADGQPPPSWITWPKSTHVLNAHFLRDPSSPPFLPFLDVTGPQAGFKDYLSARRTVSRLDEALGLLDESIQTDVEQLANRMRLADSGSSTTPGTGADHEARQIGDELRNRMQDDLDSIRRNREDTAKRSLVPGGDLNQRLTVISDSLTIADIEQTPKDAVVRLTLSESKQNGITDALQQEVRKLVTADLATIDESVEATKEEVEKQLEKLIGVRTRLHLEPIDRSGWWESLVSMARPEIRYRSEMPAATLAKRFAEARGGLSVVMLAGGLLTGLQAFVDKATLESLRTGIYASMVPILIGGLVWTFVSVRKRSAQTLEKELERLREGVLSELRKVASELLRVQGTQITQLISRIGKQLTSQTTELLKKQETQAKSNREDEMRRARERNRGLEQRSREKTQQRTELGRLRSALSDIRRLLSDWTRALSASAAPVSGAFPAASPPTGHGPLPATGSPSRTLPGVTPSPSRVLPPS